MSFRIRRDEAIGVSIQRIATEQTEKAIQELISSDVDNFERAHQVRKRCKKIRGLLRLVRPGFKETYQRENAWYRDSAKSVAFLRDSQVVLNTFNTLIKQYQKQIDAEKFLLIQQTLAKQKQELSRTTEKIEKKFKFLFDRMQQGHDRIAQWKLEKGGFETIAAGLLKTYARGKSTLQLAMDDPTATNLHQWRKRVKYHWYHARLLRQLWKPMLGVRCEEAKRLSDLLGKSHDLFVMEKALLDAPLELVHRQTIETVLSLADRRRTELRAKSYKLGQRLLAEKPKHLKKRYSCYWSVFRRPYKPETISLDAVVP